MEQDEFQRKLNKVERTLRREIAVNRHQNEQIKKLALMCIAGIIFKFNESQLKLLFENYKIYEPYIDGAIALVIGAPVVKQAWDEKDDGDEDEEG